MCGARHDRDECSRRGEQRAEAKPRSRCEACHVSPASLRRRSRRGRALVTYGTLSKLCGGGGDVAYHSSVSASHGSLPTRGTRPFRDQNAFTKKKRMPTAMIADPIEEIRLYACHHPSPSHV